jgi:hypothetical protein
MEQVQLAEVASVYPHALLDQEPIHYQLAARLVSPSAGAAGDTDRMQQVRPTVIELEPPTGLSSLKFRPPSAGQQQSAANWNRYFQGLVVAAAVEYCDHSYNAGRLVFPSEQGGAYGGAKQISGLCG